MYFLRYFNFILIPALWFLPSAIQSDEHPPTDRCRGKLSTEQVIVCVLHHSPEYKLAKHEWEASLGRRKSASYAFPTNPTVSGSTANRRGSEGGFPGLGSAGNQSAINGEILFSQEIFVGGQRTARQQFADSDTKTQWKRIQAIERFTIAETIQATIQFQTAQEEYLLSRELFELSQEIAKAAKIRFQNGIGSEMDADVAESELLQVLTLSDTAKMRWNTAKTNLTVMMGVPFSVELDLGIETKIFPIADEPMEAFLNRAEARRPDLEALEMEVQMARNRERVLERDRIPNLTISGFVQNDGFNERIVGGRVTMPIPLWRDNSGEIQEAQARTKMARAHREVGSHTVRSEATNAWNNYHSWKRLWEAYPPDLLPKTNENLRIIRDAIRSGKISIRDALVTQKSLVVLKSTYFQTKANYALSAAEYLRAGGINFSEYLKPTPQQEVSP